jgi:hypothetical protein
MSWDQLQAIVDYAKALAANPPPEVACPYCGEPLLEGHCRFDGYQTGDGLPPG